MPELLKWNDKWALGIPSLDDDHRALASLINQFGTAMGDGDVRQGVQFLEQLRDHARSHFLHEEQLMEAMGYPKRMEHQHEHVMLLAELKTLMTRLIKDNKPLHPRTVPALKEWLVAHIVGSDRDFAASYRAHPQPSEEGDLTPL